MSNSSKKASVSKASPKAVELFPRLLSVRTPAHAKNARDAETGRAMTTGTKIETVFEESSGVGELSYGRHRNKIDGCDYRQCPADRNRRFRRL